MIHLKVGQPGFVRIGQAIGHQDLMAHVTPTIAEANMQLGAGHFDRRPAVGQVPGYVAIASESRLGRPSRLDGISPTGRRHLVEIECEADVDIRRHQRKRRVARIIEAPGPIVIG